MPCRARGLLITCGLASTHTPGSFEVHCFSLMAAPDDALQLRLRRDCRSFVELEMLSHAEAARRINQDDVHVLVDMMGHTRFNRLQILSMQVFPRLLSLCNRACVCDRHPAQTQTILSQGEPSLAHCLTMCGGGGGGGTASSCAGALDGVDAVCWRRLHSTLTHRRGGVTARDSDLVLGEARASTAALLPSVAPPL